MGPKLFAVPILLGLAYVGMAYLSWTLARLTMLNARTPLVGTRVVLVPLLAAFIMVAWDLAMDPVWGTVLHAWVWKQGGTYFGVPLSNFVGWYLTVYVIYQMFALSLRRRAVTSKQLPSGYWHLAIVFYAVSAAGNLILAIPHNTPRIVSDAAGVQWKVSQIVSACAVVSVFVMGEHLQYWLGQGSRAQSQRMSIGLLNLGPVWLAKKLCTCRGSVDSAISLVL